MQPSCQFQECVIIRGVYTISQSAKSRGGTLDPHRKSSDEPLELCRKREGVHIILPKENYTHPDAFHMMESILFQRGGNEADFPRVLLCIIIFISITLRFTCIPRYLII